jgi:hypothetical protein
MQVVRSVAVATYPQDSCMHSNQVAEIDLTSWKLARLIPAGKETDGLAWAAGH